jgi:type IV secretion system protein VirD4
MHRLIYHLIVFFNRLIDFFKHTQTLHNARFASLHELTGLISHRLDDTSLLLGISHFNQPLSVRPTKTRRELGNLLVVAPVRGGKSILATSQLLTWRHSVIVNDVKGELFTQTAGYRSKLGKVFVVDPTGIGKRYDPLTGKHTEDELLSSATHLLFQPDERDKIFTQRAIVMLTQLFLAARAERCPPLPYVRHMMRLGLPDVAARLNAINPELATQFLDVPYARVNYTDRFLLDSWGTLTARLRPLLTETVVRCFTGSDFSAPDLMRSEKPITVYLRWKEQDLLALSPLVRLLWSSFIDELITTYDREQGKNCNPVLLLIDEAGRTAIPSLADHATTVSGRGVSLWIAIQDLNQLDAVYGKARAHVLRNNMETQIFYRPTDQNTAEYLERCLGRKSDYAHSQTSREGTETSEGKTEQGVPLMTAWSIKQLQDKDILGFHRNLPPFMAHRMDWRRYPILRQRRALPPPQLSPLPALATQLPTLAGKSNGYPLGYLEDEDEM